MKANTLDLFTNRVPVYRIELIREREIRGPVVTSPHEIAGLLCDYLKHKDREHFVVVMLATDSHVIGISTIHIGSLNASIVRIADTFKPAILANANSIVVAHNHPSGNPEPSREDVSISRKLVEAGKLIDIAVLDSIIVCGDGRYTSLAERGLLG